MFKFLRKLVLYKIRQLEALEKYLDGDETFRVRLENLFYAENKLVENSKLDSISTEYENAMWKYYCDLHKILLSKLEDNRILFKSQLMKLSFVQ